MICPGVVRKGGISIKDAFQPFLLLDKCPLCNGKLRLVALNYLVEHLDGSNSLFGKEIDEYYINREYLNLYRSGLNKEREYIQGCVNCSYARNCRKV